MKALALLEFCLAVAFFTCAADSNAAVIHHYVYFGRDREGITNATFLSTKALEGAQFEDRPASDRSRVD